jgi:YD repeat-containing protein
MSYTPDGLLNTFVNTNGTTTTYQYDIMGNVTQMHKQKGSHKGKNSTDELITYYEYNYNGQLTKETNPAGVEMNL